MWTIGEAAERAGVTRKAVRFYECRGLLPPAARDANGYRVFDQADVDMLAFVRQARVAGLSLTQITALAGAAPERRCELVKELARTRLVDIDAQIAGLEALRGRLTALVEAPIPTGQPGCRCVLIEQAR